MTRSMIVGLAIVALSTSAAFAAHRVHHGNPMKSNAALITAPGISPGGVNASDRATYMKNLHDSGYNPKNDFNANGTMKAQ